MAIFFAEGQDNALTERLDDLFLNHKALGLLTPVDILNRLSARNISIVNVSGEVFIEQFFEECAIAIKEGYNISTSLFRTMISIKGVIEASQLGHNISSDTVEMKANFVGGKLLADFGKGDQISIAKTPVSGAPLLQKVTNPTVKKADTLNVAGMALIEGLNIAVRGDKLDEIGVFFTSLSNPATTVRIPVEQLYPNTPTKLQFVLPPAVTAGEWRVAVATQGGANNQRFSENVRVSEYGQVITVLS